MSLCFFLRPIGHVFKCSSVQAAAFSLTMQTWWDCLECGCLAVVDKARYARDSRGNFKLACWPTLPWEGLPKLSNGFIRSERDRCCIYRPCDPLGSCDHIHTRESGIVASHPVLFALPIFVHAVVWRYADHQCCKTLYGLILALIMRQQQLDQRPVVLCCS